MKKNYRKPVMKLHEVKVRTAMLEPSVGYGGDEGTTQLSKERNAGDWEEF